MNIAKLIIRNRINGGGKNYLNCRNNKKPEKIFKKNEFLIFSKIIFYILIKNRFLWLVFEEI
jgi:hypothetical protein